MSAEKMPDALQQACESVFPEATFPNVYTGEKLEYVVWNYTEIPSVYAERAPQASRYLCQVHLYLPHKQDPLDDIQALRWALFDADFTWPSLTDASDGAGQHYVLECEFADGGGYFLPVPEPTPTPTPEPDPDPEPEPEDGEEEGGTDGETGT